MKFNSLVVAIFVCLFFQINPLLIADSNAEIQDLKKQVASLTSLVNKLSQRLEQIESEKTVITSPPPSISKPIVRSAPVQSSVYQNQNPDISVAGKAIGKKTTNSSDPIRNSIGLDEAELAMTKNISPYSKGALTLSFSDGGTKIEEAWAEFSHIFPVDDVEAKVGKFLVPCGFLNTVHDHDWPMVAKPLSMQYFFGDESFSENGLSMSKPINFSNKTYAKANIDFLQGNNEQLFHGGNSRVMGGRIFTNTMFNDKDDLNFGVNFHQGSWDTSGDLRSSIAGADIMLRRRFSQFNRLCLFGEWLWNRREQAFGSDSFANGYYLNLLYKFKKIRDWHVGFEYDCSQKPSDTRYWSTVRSAYLGYWFTENDRVQFQLRNIHDPFQITTNNEALIEIIWGMGPHKPHLANF
ncbi:MAG: hypothetical protein HQM08_11455 [Candidatus Riflebacteria bacterium]|nr:hypothetical protein [Candidatus Riflebacteria bacterium]